MISYIETDNPDLSYIVQKNPNNDLKGMTVKEVSDCYTFSYFDENKFVIYMDDSVANPNLLLNTLSAHLSHIYKDRTDLDPIIVEKDKEGFTNKFVLPCVDINEGTINLFKKYFDDYEVSYEVIEGSHYLAKVEVSTRKTLHQLINFVSLIMVYSAVYDMYVQKDLLTKYVRVFNNVGNIPYFMVYVFKSRAFWKTNLFKNFKEDLENVCREPNVELQYGDTTYQRQKFILDTFAGSEGVDILDIGCGEGNYIKRLNKFKFKGTYHAVDIDAEVLESTKARFDRKENMEWYDSFEEFSNVRCTPDTITKYNVLLTEVLEHMLYKEAELFLDKILECVNEDYLNCLVITTPNADFNDNLRLEEFGFDGMRHEDHVFEFTKDNFLKFLERIDKSKFDVEYKGLGDSVDGNHFILTAVIKPKSNEESV